MSDEAPKEKAGYQVAPQQQQQPIAPNPLSGFGQLSGEQGQQGFQPTACQFQGASFASFSGLPPSQGSGGKKVASEPMRFSEIRTYGARPTCEDDAGLPPIVETPAKR